MRPYEITLMAALLFSFSSGALALTSDGEAVSVYARLEILAMLCALVTLLLHLLREGAHWQMIPAYLAIVPAALLLFASHSTRRPFHWASLAAALVLLACSCVCSYVVPMFRLPRPTGTYPVGTSVLYMVDSSREEDAAGGRGRKRELVIQLWYPASTGKGQLASYRRRNETTLESSYQAVLPTHSRLDAAVQPASSPYPVLLFNPAWNGRRTQNTFLTEELASHGYVVASIDHPYNSQPVAFPDGRVTSAEPVPAIESMVNTTPEEVERIGNRETDKEAADDRFVLDELTRLNQQQGSRWYGTMATANSGAFGHSLGGAVAVEAWATDARVRAAVNMDGWQFGTQAVLAKRSPDIPETAQSFLPAHASPLLFLYESLDNTFNAQPAKLTPGKTKWTPDEIENEVSAWDAHHVKLLMTRYGGQALMLQGSNHPTFTDRPITSPIKRFSGAGDIDARRAHAILRDYVVQFFDQTLKNKPSPLLEGVEHKYPEMVTQMRVTPGNVAAQP